MHLDVSSEESYLSDHVDLISSIVFSETDMSVLECLIDSDSLS